MQMSVIGRTVFDLQTHSVPQARAVQEQVSRFARAALAEVLDAAVFAADDGRAVLRFSSITLDLGELTMHQLEHELGARLGAELTAFLRRQPGLRWRGAHQLSAPESPLAAFAAWLDGAPATDVGAMLRAALAEPAPAVTLLRELGRKHSVRRRLAELAEPLAADVVRCLEPEQATMVLAVVAEVAQAHQQRPLVPAARQEFTVAVWEFVFSYLLLERGSYFNTKALAAHILAGLASRYRITYRELLATLVSIATRPGLPHARGISLPALLNDLYEELPPPPAAPVMSPGSGLAALAHVLQHGVLAPSAPGVVERGLASLLDAALREMPDALRTLLRRLGAQVPVRKRLAAQAGDARLRQLVNVLEPQHGGWIVGTVDTVRSIQARRHMVHEDEQRFGRRLWEFVLQALLVERGSHFNTRAFIKSLVQQMAAATGRSYRDWLDSLAAYEPMAAGGARRVRLARVLGELRREQQALDVLAVPPDAPRAAARTLLLREWPVPGADARQARSALSRLVQQLARRHRIDVHQLLTELARDEGGLAAATLDEQALRALLLSLHEEWLSTTGAVGMRPRSAPVPAPSPSGNMARAVREFAVRSLVLERGSWFNDRSYVEDLVRRLARRHGLAYGQLLTTLVAATTGRVQAGRGTTLPVILRTLQADQQADVADADTDADAGWRFLRDGRPGTGPGWRRLLQQGPALGEREAVLAALRADRDGALLTRLVDYLPPAQLRRLLDWLAPDFAGALESLLLAGGSERGQWQAVLSALTGARVPASLVELLAAIGQGVAPAAPAAYWRQVWRAARAHAGEARFAVLVDLCETQLRRLGAPVPRSAGTVSGQAVWPAAPAAPLLAQALGRLLRLGASGWQAAWDGAPDQAALYAQLADAMRAEPRRFLAVLRAACMRPLERERLAHLLPPALRAEAVRVLCGRAAAQPLWWRSLLSESLAALAPRLAAQAWLEIVDAELLQMLARGGTRRPDLATWLLATSRRAWLDGALPLPRLLERLRAELARMDTARRRAATRLLDHVASQPAPPAPVPAQVAPENTPVEVRNAGMVLLWPFLVHLFDALGLTAAGQFRGEAERMRAVYLLDYLVCGRIDAPEEELALPKILCGMALEDALEPGPAPSEQERELCTSLLSAVIAHWSRLGNTSPDSLQETFLQRAGELRRKEEHWQLRVPERAFDILLTTLPWTLGTIRLSWMKEILWVSWK